LKHLLSAAAFLSLLWGCHFRPPKAKVPIAVPKKFSRSGQKRLPAQWWKAFRDPQLNRLVEMALAGNMDLRAVWDRLDQARAQAKKEGGGFYPTVEGQVQTGVSFSKKTTTTNPATGTSISTGGVTPNYLIGVAASYEIDLWGRVRASRKAARRDVRAGRETLRAAAISLSAEVAVAYFMLIEVYGRIRLLQTQTDANAKLLELVALRMGFGQTGAVDLLQQKQLLESIRGEVVQAQAEARILEQRLALLCGRPPQSQILDRAVKIRTLPPLPPLPATGVPARLIRRRPDVRAAYHKVEAANERVAVAIADRFPKLSLSASAQVSDDSIRTLFDNWLVNLAANLLGPIFDGWRRKAEVARTKAAASEALHSYGQTVLKALAEVEEGLTRERFLQTQQKSLQAQLRLSDQVVERARHNYVNGADDYLRVLDAQLKHQNLQRTALSLKRKILENRIALCRALAGGWKMKRPSAKKKKAQRRTPRPQRRTSTQAGMAK
jgi:NodT family efflux transporter outer membrane factor (OMF) lipoprotein